MGRNARKRISYVLPLANSAGGHRLGVNGLAVDAANSILYSGGRDGVICAWDLQLDLSRNDDERDPFADSNAAGYKPPPTQFRSQVQAHTHWINDIVLAHDNGALVSASSDITVKVWRPAAAESLPPQTIGLHTDYVKRVVSPGQSESWVASGGLDRKISLWDLNGAGKKLDITVGDDENTAKGSVYALAATPHIIASGGPESIVRVWDARTGNRITKFVGHTDNVRDILLAQDGDTILSASSDQTVKVWSMTAGRCMYTLTMHNDSVWSLFSDNPQLSVFYSSDRSGLVAKSDVRHCAEMDEGLSVAVCQEHEGVNKLIAAGDYVWTATSNSGINRWNDVETAAEVELPESYKWHRTSITTRTRYPSSPASSPKANGAAPKIPFKALLLMANTAPFPQLSSPKEAEAVTVASPRKPSEVLTHPEHGIIVPVRSQPDFSIEGQNGLIKHHFLNDRRRVLTVDTAGEVTLWDLLQCAPIKSFGKRHLEDVVPEVNTKESVAHWCAVDTRIGTLTCMLEENYCFDAEMYADELQLDEPIDFRDDHRINLGKWILRYLFSNLIDEEIRRDQAFRADLVSQKSEDSKAGRPTNIQLPNVNISGWNQASSGPASGATIKATNGFHIPHTPGLAIGLATPMAPPSTSRNSQPPLLTPTAEESTQLERSQTQRSTAQEGGDYFSQGASATNGDGDTNGHTKPAETPAETKDEPLASPTEPDTPAKKGKGMFGKKFNMSFNMKKFGSGTAATEPAKPAAVDEKAEDSDSRSTKTNERTVEDNFYGSIQRIRQGYEDQISTGATKLESAIAPSLPSDTPVLKPPASTTILIQEDRPEAGGVADLFEGKVGSLGLQADLIEKAAPMWLGEVLLRNTLPPKEIIKVSFVLEPHPSPAPSAHPQLPSISADGYIPFSLPFEAAASANAALSNNRLNANRMLRARKILAYVAERIEVPVLSLVQQEQQGLGKKDNEEAEEESGLRPEEYLELWCNGQLIPPTMTLASIRAHVWRGGGDVLLLYKANGRKKIATAKAPPQISAPTVSAGGELGQAQGTVVEAKQSSEGRSSEQSTRGVVEGRSVFGP